jgi:hypothetical protein
MSKHFRRWKIDDIQLLPPSVQDYVAKGHLSRLIVALVRESLDLSEIAGQLPERRGSAAIRSVDDDGAASARLCERRVLVAADRQGLPARDVERLKALSLIEEHESHLRLTPTGRKRYKALPSITAAATRKTG